MVQNQENFSYFALHPDTPCVSGSVEACLRGGFCGFLLGCCFADVILRLLPQQQEQLYQRKHYRRQQNHEDDVWRQSVKRLRSSLHESAVFRASRHLQLLQQRSFIFKYQQELARRILDHHAVLYHVHKKLERSPESLTGATKFAAMAAAAVAPVKRQGRHTYVPDSPDQINSVVPIPPRPTKSSKGTSHDLKSTILAVQGSPATLHAGTMSATAAVGALGRGSNILYRRFQMLRCQVHCMELKQRDLLSRQRQLKIQQLQLPQNVVMSTLNRIRLKLIERCNTKSNAATPSRLYGATHRKQYNVETKSRSGNKAYKSPRGIFLTLLHQQMLMMRSRPCATIGVGWWLGKRIATLFRTFGAILLMV